MRKVQLGEVTEKGRNHWFSGAHAPEGNFEDSSHLQLHSTFNKWEWAKEQNMKPTNSKFSIVSKSSVPKMDHVKTHSVLTAKSLSLSYKAFHSQRN